MIQRVHAAAIATVGMVALSAGTLVVAVTSTPDRAPRTAADRAAAAPQSAAPRSAPRSTPNGPGAPAVVPNAGTAASPNASDAPANPSAVTGPGGVSLPSGIDTRPPQSVPTAGSDGSPGMPRGAAPEPTRTPTPTPQPTPTPTPTAPPAPTTTAAPPTTTLARNAEIPSDWPAGKPLPPMPANCVEPHLEDNGVWNCGG